MTKLLLKTYFELKEIQNDVGSYSGAVNIINQEKINFGNTLKEKTKV